MRMSRTLSVTRPLLAGRKVPAHETGAPGSVVAYASGRFDEPWFTLAFKPAEELTAEDKTEILGRAFQLNHERLMSRWPRFVALFESSRPASGATQRLTLTSRDW